MMWLIFVFSGSQHKETVDMLELLKNHVQKYMTIAMLLCDRQHINIRRKHVWSDMRRAMKRLCWIIFTEWWRWPPFSFRVCCILYLR